MEFYCFSICRYIVNLKFIFISCKHACGPKVVDPASARVRAIGGNDVPIFHSRSHQHRYWCKRPSHSLWRGRRRGRVFGFLELRLFNCVESWCVFGSCRSIHNIHPPPHPCTSHTHACVPTSWTDDWLRSTPSMTGTHVQAPP